MFRESGDYTFLVSFTPAPSLEKRLERRRSKLFGLMSEAIDSHSVEAFMAVIEAGESGDPPYPIREKLDARAVAKRVRVREWSEEQIEDLFGRLGIPVPEPEPEPEPQPEPEPVPEPEATTQPEPQPATEEGMFGVGERAYSDWTDDEKDALAADIDLAALLA